MRTIDGSKRLVNITAILSFNSLGFGCHIILIHSDHLITYTSCNLLGTRVARWKPAFLLVSVFHPWRRIVAIRSRLCRRRDDPSGCRRIDARERRQLLEIGKCVGVHVRLRADALVYFRSRAVELSVLSNSSLRDAGAYALTSCQCVRRLGVQCLPRNESNG